MVSATANPMVHWELLVGDIAKAKSFYGRVFDWQFDDKRFPGYTTIVTGAEPGGGMMQRPASSPLCSLNAYFAVPSIDETLSIVVELGGKVLVAKTAIPGVGSFAMFADPDGIPVGLLQQA